MQETQIYLICLTFLKTYKSEAQSFLMLLSQENVEKMYHISTVLIKTVIFPKTINEIQIT